MSVVLHDPGSRLPAEFVSVGVSPPQVLSILKAYRKRILICAVGCFVLGFVFAKVAPKTYTSTATVLVDFRGSDPITGQEFQSGVAESYMATQVDAVDSTPVLLPVIQALGWDHDPEHLAGFHGTKGSEPQFVLETELEKNLSVKAGSKDSRLIYITYSAKDATLAANVANMVANSYVRQANDRYAAPLQARVQGFQEQVDAARKRVDDAQQKVNEYRQATGLIDLDSKVDVEGQRLLELNTRLVDAEANMRLSELKQQESSRNGSISTDVLGSTEVQALKTQLATAQAQLAEVQGTLGPRHPQVIGLQDQIRSLQARISAETRTYTESTNATARSDAANVAEIRREIEEAHARTMKVRAAQDQAAILMRDLDSAKAYFEKSLDALNQARTTQGGRYSNINVISPAAPPSRPSKYLARVLAPAGLFLGLIVSCAFALFWEFTHRRIRIAEDLLIPNGPPVLAVLGAVK